MIERDIKVGVCSVCGLEYNYMVNVIYYSNQVLNYNVPCGTHQIDVCLTVLP